ncbi:MAG: AAA family ATPase [Saprospirales bacterium]|nr:AAA family ATPase [Saprospirales bacterium]
MALQKLPIGLQDFRKIRENDFKYIDKTRYIYQALPKSRRVFSLPPAPFRKVHHHRHLAGTVFGQPRVVQGAVDRG